MSGCTRPHAVTVAGEFRSACDAIGKFVISVNAVGKGTDEGPDNRCV
jgi:hypothetical protein